MNTQTSTGEWLTIDEAVEATTRTKKAIMAWVYKHKVNAKKMADETWLIDKDSLLETHSATQQRSVAGESGTPNYEYVTVKQACEMTSRTKKAIMKWVYDKKVVAFKTEHGWLINQESLWKKDAVTNRRVCVKRRTNAEILADNLKAGQVKVEQQMPHVLQQQDKRLAAIETFMRNNFTYELVRLNATLLTVEHYTYAMSPLHDDKIQIITNFRTVLQNWIANPAGRLNEPTDENAALTALKHLRQLSPMTAVEFMEDMQAQELIDYDEPNVDGVVNALRNEAAEVGINITGDLRGLVVDLIEEQLRWGCDDHLKNALQQLIASK